MFVKVPTEAISGHSAQVFKMAQSTVFFNPDTMQCTFECNGRQHIVFVTGNHLVLKEEWTWPVIGDLVIKR